MKGWKTLTSIAEVDLAVEASHQHPIVFFKHSTRCSISSMAWNRIVKINEDESKITDFYFLDLIQYRDVSNYIAEKLSVYHESPQIIIVKNGEATLDISHLEIQPKEILENI